MDKCIAGQGRSRALLYYHGFDFAVFQSLTESDLSPQVTCVHWLEGRESRMEKDENMSFGWRKTEHVQRPWGRRMLGVCEELLVNQRSGAKGMNDTWEGGEDWRGEKESGEGGRKEEGQVTGGLRATTKTRPFPAGEMVLNWGRSWFRLCLGVTRLLRWQALGHAFAGGGFRATV